MYHKEREQKELRERGDSASALRRKIVESVSSIERSFARRYNHGAKPKGQEKEAYGNADERSHNAIYRKINATISITMNNALKSSEFHPPP